MSMCDRTERACIISGGASRCATWPLPSRSNSKLIYPASGAKKYRLVFPCWSGKKKKKKKKWVFSTGLGEKKKKKKGKEGGDRLTGDVG